VYIRKEKKMLNKHTQEQIAIRKWRQWGKKATFFLAGIFIGIMIMIIVIPPVTKAWNYNLCQYDRYYINIPSK